MSQKLRVAELDFDSIKSNLKEFLRTKPGFTDYDYEGSTLSVLLDALAYNTHYNAVTANMLIQEVFLGTAVKKSSVAMHAQKLGYVPKSGRAAKAVVNLEVFPVGSPSTLTLGKGAIFTARTTLNQNFQFVTRGAVTITQNTNSRWIFSNLPIYEGTLQTFKYVYNDTVPTKFEIPSTNVDTSLLRVYVQKSQTNTEIVEYKYFNSTISRFVS